MSSIKSIESLDIHESSPRPPFQDGEPAGVAAKQLYMANRAPSEKQEPETLVAAPECEGNLEEGLESLDGKVGENSAKIILSQSGALETPNSIGLQMDAMDFDTADQRRPTALNADRAAAATSRSMDEKIVETIQVSSRC